MSMSLQMMMSLALTATVLYITASTLIHCYVLKTRLRPPTTPGGILRRYVNFNLGFFAITMYWFTIILYTQPSTHGLSAGILLVAGVACLVMGERFIYYPDTPTRKEE